MKNFIKDSIWFTKESFKFVDMKSLSNIIYFPIAYVKFINYTLRG